MTQQQCIAIEQRLRQIADLLVLHGTLTDCPGLVHGKIGIAIFFLHYARYTGNGLFEDYAFDLIGEMLQQIHNNSPADYEKGIAGIGVGIDYLIRNGFVESEECTFNDFDKRMYRAVMYDPWQDLSMYDGLTGFGKYWIMRLHNNSSTKKSRECLIQITKNIEEKIPDISIKEKTDVLSFLHNRKQALDYEIIDDFIIQCKGDLKATNITIYFPRLGNSVVGKFARNYQLHCYFDHTQVYDYDLDMKYIFNSDIGMMSGKMGLLTGHAGEGMILLSLLNQINMNWLHLL